MRRRLASGSALLLLALAIACASLQTNIYKSLASTAQTADFAHNAFKELDAAGRITPEARVQAKAAYQKYQEAMLFAQAAYQTWKAAGFPGNQADSVSAAASNAAIAGASFTEAAKP